MIKDLNKFLITPGAPIIEAIKQIDEGGIGIVLVVDEEKHLLGTITDGDIRRAVLLKVDLASPSLNILDQKKTSIYPEPVTATANASREKLLKIMQERVVKQVPLVDDENRVVDIATIDSLVPAKERNIEALIMAGGYGKRLHPLTVNTPKPMLPLGEQSVMELIISQLKKHGVNKVTISTHFMPELIKEHFKDGEEFGVEIKYIEEKTQLGTAGALGLISEFKKPLLVINGDIVTNLDFGAFLDFHSENQARMSVAVRLYSFQVPYGVLDCIEQDIVGIREKPVHNFFVNAGIYIVEPECQELVPRGDRFDMTDLIQILLDRKKKVVSFPIVEYWLDIGEHSDYKQAQTDYGAGKLKKS